MIDLSGVSRLPRKRMKDDSGSASTPLRKIDIVIEMTMGSDKGVLIFTAWVGKKKVGQVTVDYSSATDLDGIRTGGLY